MNKNYFSSFAIGALLVLMSSIAVAQSAETTIAEQRGSLMGFGSGIAAAIAMSIKPTRIEKIPSTESYGAVERRIYTRVGMKVAVMAATDNSFVLPELVEISSPQAIRLISKELSELNKSDVIANYGKPFSQTADSYRYQGPAESCEEYVDLIFRSEKMSRLKWTFCSE